MSRRVTLLATDWERLRRARPGVDDWELAGEAVRRGVRLSREPLVERVPAGLPVAERLALLRRRFARRAAAVAVQRFEYVTGRERFARAAHVEQRTYEEHLELDKDVVPPLKEEARALRAEVRRLEAELRTRGGDPEAIEPRIDWDRTLAVDTYARPEYQSNAGRRSKAVEFFRRTGPK